MNQKKNLVRKQLKNLKRNNVDMNQKKKIINST